MPKNKHPDELYVVKEGGRLSRKYLREVLICNKVVGDILVPEGNGRPVPYTENPEDVWYTAFGIPRITSDDPQIRHTTHLWFNNDPPQDINAGRHRDVAIVRMSYPLNHKDRRCIDIFATYWRFNSGEDYGFRPVKGPLPKIEELDLEPDESESEALIDRMG